MKLLLGSIIASFALEASAQNYNHVHQVQPNDIPAACRNICTPVYYLGQVCNQLAQRLNTGYSHYFEGECVCRAGNAANSIGLCAGCVTQQGQTNPNVNGALDLARDCAVSPSGYSYNAGYNSAITVATVGYTTTLYGDGGYNGGQAQTQPYTNYGNGGQVPTQTYPNGIMTPTFTNFAGGGLVTPTFTRYGNNGGGRPQPYTTTYIQTYNGGQYATTATVTPYVVNAGTKARSGLGAIFVAALVCLFTF